MRHLLLASLCFTAFVATTSIGEAALPKLKTKLIVPGESLGGVALGSSFKAAKKAWGKGGKCANQFGSRTCEYAAKNQAGGRGQFFGAPGEKVSAVRILAGTDDASRPVYDTPLAKFKTKKGIHLGSSAAAVEKAYPKAKSRRVPGAQGFEYFLKGPGKASTSFSVGFAADGQVQAITISTPR